MLRLMVLILLACNLLLVGLHVASAPHDRPEPVIDAPPLPPGVPELQLVDELAPEDRPGFGDARQCFSAGPFETVPTLVRAREALGPAVQDITERQSEALVELGYWVALPPMADFAEAGKAMQGLQKAGLQDMAVVTDETGEFRVSLGYFLEEANARRRRDHARSLGFEAETRLQRETQLRYWLDYAFTDDALADRAASALPAGQQRSIPCPEGVASQ